MRGVEQSLVVPTFREEIGVVKCKGIYTVHESDKWIRAPRRTVASDECFESAERELDGVEIRGVCGQEDKNHIKSSAQIGERLAVVNRRIIQNHNASWSREWLEVGEQLRYKEIIEIGGSNRPTHKRAGKNSVAIDCSDNVKA